MSETKSKPKADKKAHEPKAAEKHKKPAHKHAESKEHAKAKTVHKAEAPEHAKAKEAVAPLAPQEEVKVSVSDAQVSEVAGKSESEEKKSAGGFRAQKKVQEKKEAEKKEKKVLAERIYTIPLDSVMRSTRKKRANKAVRVLRSYVSRHMHSDNVKVSESLNELIWSRGIQKPPRYVKVKVLKYEDSVVAELLG